LEVLFLRWVGFERRRRYTRRNEVKCLSPQEYFNFYSRYHFLKIWSRRVRAGALNIIKYEVRRVCLVTGAKSNPAHKGIKNSNLIRLEFLFSKQTALLAYRCARRSDFVFLRNEVELVNKKYSLWCDFVFLRNEVELVNKKYSLWCDFVFLRNEVELVNKKCPCGDMFLFPFS